MKKINLVWLFVSLFVGWLIVIALINFSPISKVDDRLYHHVEFNREMSFKECLTRLSYTNDLANVLVSAKNDDNQNVLIFAAKKQRKDIVLYLLRNYQSYFDLNQLDVYGRDFIQYVSYSNDFIYKVNVLVAIKKYNQLHSPLANVAI